MIFITVGGQLPFDRMVNTIDDWAGRTGRKDIFAQVGKDGKEPKNFPSANMLKPEEFSSYIEKAEVVISHAGLGTILTMIDIEKPLLVMPRKAEFGEHRNDHQIATVNKLNEEMEMSIAMDEPSLESYLADLSQIGVPKSSDKSSRPQLLNFLRNYILS